LRRYELYWRAAHDQRLEVADRMKQLADQTAAMKAADAVAQEVKKQRTKEKADLESDQKKLAGDHEVAKKHLAELNEAAKTMQSGIKDTFVKNRTLAAELTRMQVQASERTNAKVGSNGGR
jgi:hypothetical protein